VIVTAVIRNMLIVTAVIRNMLRVISYVGLGWVGAIPRKVCLNAEQFPNQFPTS
jgi:hypothetical protein